MSAERSSGAHLRTQARAGRTLRASVISLAPEDSCRLNASTLEGSIVRPIPVATNPFSARAPAVRPNAEHVLRRFAEYAFLLRLVEVRALDYFPRLGIADREGLIRAEHDALGCRLLGEVLERIRVEHARVEVHRLEALARVGVLPLRDGVVAHKAPERVGQRRAAVRDPELHAR